MPLVAHSKLPSFARLEAEGEEVLALERAHQQDIRELHIGLLNMMPDSALQATERQFLRLVGGCNRIAQFYVHPFTVRGIDRSSETQAYIDTHYASFDDLERTGLDALIITGANVTQSDFSKEPFWPELQAVLDFAAKKVTSTLCACLATHAALRHFHGIERRGLEAKCWGVFEHQTLSAKHPLTRNINTRFHVPHSRFNDISVDQARAAGLRVLVESQTAGLHLAVSEDLMRFVYFQGHPEYDRNSLLKEYKRELGRFAAGTLSSLPPLPEKYMLTEGVNHCAQFASDLTHAENPEEFLMQFPEDEVLNAIDNTWGDTAKIIFNNWLGTVYQLTNRDRTKPFMPGIDPADPLQLKAQMTTV
ncbi:MAG: homoserine O-succinyltransferase [Myxococcota bacterium]|nr:homoserine O-succinyltransferase [Myxococcota bacterium]